MPVYTRKTAAEMGVDVEKYVVRDPTSRRELAAVRELICEEIPVQGVASGAAGNATTENGADLIRFTNVNDNGSSVSLNGRNHHSPRMSRSGHSYISSSSRRRLEIEEKRAALNEELRQNQIRLAVAKAEADRILEQQHLLDLRSQCELEEDEVDRRSIVFSVPSGRPDVENWVDQQQQITRQDDIISISSQGHLSERAIPAITPQPRSTGNQHYTQPEGYAQHDRKVDESNSFKLMADTIANAMQSVMHSAPANNDNLKHFAARQTVAKELPEFNGNPEDWPMFLAKFQRSTEICGFSDEENVFRLQKCLKGKAKESVVSMLSSACRLDDIMDVLKKRFGRPDQIMKKMLEKAKAAPSPVEEDFHTLVDFSIAVKNFCATAESLQLPLYLNNPQLVEEFQKKLPAHLQLEWGRHRVKIKRDANLLDLSIFLDEVSDAAVFVCQDPVNQPKKPKSRDQCLVVTSIVCPMKCKEGHSLATCPRFRRMKISERWECVKKLRLCFSCLGKGHAREKCPTPFPCGRDGCKMNHDPMLHYVKKPKDGDTGETGENGKTSKNEEIGSAARSKHMEKDKAGSSVHGVIGVVSQVPVQVGDVLMKIVPVQLFGPKGRIVVNAFLDDGSSLTMIDKQVADSLGLDGECKALHLNWLGGRSDHDQSSRLVKLKIRGVDEADVFELENVRTKRNLKLPVVPMSNYKNLKKWKHLGDIRFPEVQKSRPALIIGSDNCHLLLPRKSVEGPKKTPIASWTYLGWVVHGPTGSSTSRKVFHTSFLNIEGMDPDQALHELVKEQFRIEALGVVNCPNPPQSKQNERAVAIMEDTSRHVEKQWITGLLWKEDNVKLPESRHAAERRLKLLEKKMDADKDVAKLYCAKIDEYVQKGFCHKLSEEELQVISDRVWYLPHFGSTNPNKPGKLRLVFDCAAKVNGMSLNDALIQGPDLMSPLINVLLKFRQSEIAFSGDIRDMFHMVKIRKEDVPALRFLWRGMDRTEPPAVYSMDVMVFGAVSSPFQAQWIKNMNASEFQVEFPEAVDAVHNRHYVDDYLDSCETPEQAIKKIIDVRNIHRHGGFEIRGWLCNNEDVLKVVAPGELQNAQDLAVEGDKLERVLGLHWDPKRDVFKFKVTFRMIDPKIISGDRMPTKRELLKLIMSLFDPLGFLGHLTVRGRMLLQDVWKSGISWDEKLGSCLEEKWQSLLSQILKIPDAVIPRCFAPEISQSQSIQLHVLCDASQQAYGCVAYFRATGRGGEASVNIVMSKTRVAPIKPMSIPRLEMEAALVGARTANFIKKNTDVQIDSTYLWTDSKNVLCWIKAEDPGKFKMYIAHRIGEILDLTEKENWKWVPTGQNVADGATRDSSEADLSSGSRWFCGPPFLMESEELWPKEKRISEEDVKLEDLEVKKACCLAIVEHNWLPVVNDYSNWMRLIRVTAWMRRFVKNGFSGKSGVSGENGKSEKCRWLTVAEIEDAKLLWIRRCQEDTFAEELDCLRHGKLLEKSSRLLRLSPVLDDGIIVVRSRLVNAPQLSQKMKFPAILDPKHAVTKLLIAWYHKVHGHHGIDLICNEIRQRFWILGLRAAVKKAAKECLECQMEAAKQVVPEMAALPEVRVVRPNRPFSFVGVDYFGPFEVTNGRKREKRYGALFTCLSTRAVHLEMANSLSTDDFMLVLNRFIGRRGEPLEIWSDNGTNFRGAETEMKKALLEMDQEKLNNRLGIKGIKWHFIPPGAPHMGGAWERLVRSVKAALSVILKGRTLNDQVLATVLVEAEASVNSRPLTPVSIDKDDPAAITPNCFLMGTTSVKQRPGVFEDGDLSLRKRWRHAQVLADHFWNRWLKEYLPTLSLRAKWNRDVPEIIIGELVFVADMNQQRNQWKKGIVESVYPGNDGHVRVVDVRTADGVIKRPVSKLYRIPGWNIDGDFAAQNHWEGNVGE